VASGERGGKVKIYCDGSGWNGRESKWCVVYDGKTNIERYDYERTNNEMEYAAVLWAANKAVDGDVICTDSQLVVNQVNGKWRIKEPRLKDFYVSVQSKLWNRNIGLVWIPREENLAGKVLEKGK